MSPCPCGSATTYDECCGCFISKKQVPQTPEQLMRSRYTAFSLAKVEYIQETMKGRAALGFQPEETKKWAKNITWLGLEIIHSKPSNNQIGFVEFIARFMEADQIKQIHEQSEFHQENGRWFYVDGIQKQTHPKTRKVIVARNNPCPCGSGKKYKNCHAN